MARTRKTTLGMTSRELDAKYPFWRKQATSKGGHNTVSSTTISTYKSIADFILKKHPNATVLDASSGAGKGTEYMKSKGIKVEDVEPFVSSDRKKPTYTDYKDIKKKYDIVVSNAVINVIPDDWRSDLIKKMGALVKKGGLLIINTRTSNEIRNTKGITLDDDAEKLIPKSKDSYAYQRGHDINEWIGYIEACLNNRFTSKAKFNFEVKKATVANSGVGTGKAILCIKQ